jgi:hypothetical protein
MGKVTAEQYRPGDGLAIVCGRPSNDLVCVDLDDMEVVRLADEHLPPTAMCDGRPGKPSSHRYFRAIDIPDDLKSTAANGIGGPRKIRLVDKYTGKTFIDIQGTGSLVVCPPSLHHTGETRVWYGLGQPVDQPGEPASIPYRELVDRCRALATAAGCRLKADPGPIPKPDMSAVDPALRAIPVDERVRRCRAYLTKVPDAVSGFDGSHNTFRPARIIVVDFLLAEHRKEAWDLLCWFNREKCDPAWPPHELAHKFRDALKKPADSEHPWGCKLKQSAPPAGPSKVATARAVPISAADLVRREFPDPVFAVPGLVPTGLAILAAKPKIGKSWLALQLAGAVARGGAALGSIRVEKGEAMYLALEDSARRLKGRLLTQLAATGDTIPAGLFLADNWPRLCDGGLERLDAWLAAHPATRLVIIDTFAKVRSPARGRGEGVYMDDYAAISPLKELADRYGVALMVVHHLRKSRGTKDESSDPFDLITGSTGLSGAADVMMVLTRARGENAARLVVTGRDIEDRDLALTFDGERCLWELAPDQAVFLLSRERREVLAFLHKKPGSTPLAVANGLAKNRDTIRGTLRKMLADGQVEIDADGRYYSAGE